MKFILFDGWIGESINQSINQAQRLIMSENTKFYEKIPKFVPGYQ